MSNKKYIIWGTGWEAEKFYYQFHNQIEISYFVDSFHYDRKFYGLDVKKPDKSVLGGKILIASSACYEEIKKQLMEMEFEEYKDFIYCFDFNKKIVFINGNCHCRILRSYLNTSNKFTQQYAFGDFPLVCEPRTYDESMLKYCDLIMYQDIRKDNSVDYRYSEDYILPKLRKDCVKCCIPNLYGFPKALYMKNYKLFDSDHRINNKYNPFLYCEEMIDECVKSNETFEQICSKIQEKFIEEKDIIAQFNCDKERLLEREKGWDIKISDYIYENYQTVQLFYDVGHATNVLLKEIANRILAYLGIDDTVSENIKDSLNFYEVPVYDCIKDALGLKWNNYYLKKGMVESQHFERSGAKVDWPKRFALIDTEMDWREYVKEYIWWHYGKEVV